MPRINDETGKRDLRDRGPGGQQSDREKLRGTGKEEEAHHRREHPIHSLLGKQKTEHKPQWNISHRHGQGRDEQMTHIWHYISLL